LTSRITICGFQRKFSDSSYLYTTLVARGRSRHDPDFRLNNPFSSALQWCLCGDKQHVCERECLDLEGGDDVHV